MVSDMKDAADTIGLVEPEKIPGLFRQLKKEKTLVRMSLAGHELSGLTLVNDVRASPSPPQFLVDTVKGLAEALWAAETYRFAFEFTGAEGALFRFGTSGGRPVPNGIWVPFPENIERIQRRKDFRLSVLPGTRILYQTDAVRGAIKLIDISVGGGFGVMVRLKAGGAAGDFLREGGVISNLVLEIPLGNETRTVRIRSARIRRLIKRPDDVRPRCALQYLEIDGDQKRILVNAVYDLQRVYLQIRRGLR
jgi:hypothetical protein